jgi:hypothetical protein
VIRRLRLTALAVAVAATVVGAQGDRPGRDPLGNPPYDGRFTLVRLRWQSSLGGGFFRGGGNAWNHDYPRAERNLALIVKELTKIDINLDDSLILTLDDPELFKYPVSFMWEPGAWNLNDREAESFRAYLLKGGFTIFEDFDGPRDWFVFTEQMRRVLPEGQFIQLDNRHSIFNSFFQIQDIHAILHPLSSGLRPSYWGIFEDNDPSKRLMVVANFDNDIPEYWEWSGTGFNPFNMSNEAYKIGVNYLIYGLTH